MIHMNATLHQYCTGCGLCQSLGYARLITDRKGFSHPIEGDEKFLKNICPSFGVQTRQLEYKEIWGKLLRVFYGWSNDAKIRDLGSSGGVTTSICMYLLDEHLADAVIHVCADPINPTKTITCLSTTGNELIERCGSRYAISSPLDIIGELDNNKRYVFVGKPCDVDVLRNFQRLVPAYADIIPYVFSFFCMGLPSNDAQISLLQSLGCDENNCISLKYRGDGWPGLTKAVDKDGEVYTTDYDSSWGKVLGRDLMPMCRFCINGIGETADISSGDAWYLGEDDRPVFTENKGRNVVFARSEKGLKILESASMKGYLSLTPFDNYREELPKVQYAQYERRISLNSRLYALKILMKPYPKYNRKVLAAFHKKAPLMQRWKFFKGTLKRVIKF